MGRCFFIRRRGGKKGKEFGVYKDVRLEKIDPLISSNLA